MATEQVELPILIAGERPASAGRELLRFEYDDVTVVLPAPTVADAQRIAGSDRRALRELSIDDVVQFFEEAGSAWRDPGNEWRALALELGARVTGYPRELLAFDADFLGHVLTRAKQYDFLQTDLGDPAVLDEWIASQAVYHRCWPRGLAVHVMVGNVPLAGLFTLYRSLICKNVTAAKLPQRDVVTTLCFAQCLYDVDPRHPVVRALSTLYWEPESEIEDLLLQAADVVSVWGRETSVESIKGRLPHGTDCIEFGPKRSLIVVLDGVESWTEVAKRVAHDVAVYDQEACFSPQEIYVQGDPAALVGELAGWLANATQTLPARPATSDAAVHAHRARVEAVARGWDVTAPPETDWTIVVTDGPAALREHPLGRCVYVHPIRDLTQVLATVDRDTQTVAVEPWSSVWTVADALTAAGADRLVPLGRMSVFRPGAIHDGFHPMRRLVRWSTIERPLSYRYRFSGANDVALEQQVITGRLTPRAAAVGS